MSLCIVCSRDWWEFSPFNNDSSLPLRLCNEAVKESIDVDIRFHAVGLEPLNVIHDFTGEQHNTSDTNKSLELNVYIHRDVNRMLKFVGVRF